MSNRLVKLDPVQEIISALVGFSFACLICLIATSISSTYDLAAAYLRLFNPLDANRYPGVIVIECAWATDHDRVYVYAGKNGFKPHKEPMSRVDFEDDVWVFDVGADGSAQLILQFALEDGRATAYLYDDRDGDGMVSFRVKGNEVEVTESKYWHVKIRSSGNKWIHDGVVNPNLTFWVDGPVLRYLTWGEVFPGRAWALQNINTDGHVDWLVEIADIDEDGSADYQLQRLLADFPEDMAVFRSTLYIDKNRRTPGLYPDFVFWPLLVGSHDYENYNYFDHSPAVSIVWEHGKIDRVGILGYPSEQGFHINSRSAAWQNHKINYADFENPMAYYDLAGDRDGQAELFIRFEVFSPHDRFFLNGQFPYPMTSVDYAWDQNNDGGWDYQLSLGGRQAISSQIHFPEFSLWSIPYREIPAWVNEEQWDAALLVAAENGGHWNSEGMSIWNLNRGFRDGETIEPSGLRDGYLTGRRDDPPVGDYEAIQEGFRGEWAFEYFRKPGVYMSPVDGKLHLSHAAAGVWNIDGENEVRYANLDGDAYLDRWENWVGGELREGLSWMGDILIYSGEGEVVVKEVDIPPARFERSLPQDHEGWLALKDLIEAQKRDFGGSDLRGMLAGVPGRETRIQGAEVRDVRRIEGEWGFMLRLEAGFEVVGGERLGLSGLQPGAHWVSHAGEYQVSAITPAALEITPVYEQAWLNSIQVWEDTRLTFRISNPGREDAGGARLKVTFQPAQGHAGSTWEAAEEIEVPAGGFVEVAVPWRSTAGGAWRVRAEAAGWGEAKGGQGKASYEGRIGVGQVEEGAGEGVRAKGMALPGTMPALLAGILMCGGAAGWAWLRFCSSQEGPKKAG